MFRRFLKALHSEDRGQDLAEYCLLTALVALIALGIFVHVSGGVQAVWSSANTSLTEGHAASTATPATAGTPASSGQPASTATPAPADTPASSDGH
jgi:Flp pilus assembly pilin Flp